MTFIPLIPERLTWCDVGNGVRYEAWRTPEIRPGWHLYCFRDDVEIGKHSYGSDTEVRKAFEQAVSNAAINPSADDIEYYYNRVAK